MRFYPFEYHEKKVENSLSYLYLYSQLKFLSYALQFLNQAKIQSSKCSSCWYYWNGSKCFDILFTNDLLNVNKILWPKNSLLSGIPQMVFILNWPPPLGAMPVIRRKMIKMWQHMEIFSRSGSRDEINVCDGWGWVCLDHIISVLVEHE